MSDFDIASLKNANTFAASLQKRKAHYSTFYYCFCYLINPFVLGKAMGLMDSDSEDEAPKKKTTKPVQPKSSPVDKKEPRKETDAHEFDDQDIIKDNISTTAEYIRAAEALMAQPIRKASQEQPKKKPANTIHPSQVDHLMYVYNIFFLYFTCMNANLRQLNFKVSYQMKRKQRKRFLCPELTLKVLTPS